jgi:hypothetical protein
MMEEALLARNEEGMIGAPTAFTEPRFGDDIEGMEQFIRDLDSGVAEKSDSEIAQDWTGATAATIGADKLLGKPIQNALTTRLLPKLVAGGARLLPNVGAAMMAYEAAPHIREQGHLNQEHFDEFGVEMGTDLSFYSKQKLQELGMAGDQAAMAELDRRSRVTGETILPPQENALDVKVQESINSTGSEMESPIQSRRPIPEDPDADLNGDGILSDEEIDKYRISRLPKVINPFED